MTTAVQLDHCGPLCPFLGCSSCTYQGGTDTERPRKEE